jgi:hypothetical protein
MCFCLSLLRLVEGFDELGYHILLITCVVLVLNFRNIVNLYQSHVPFFLKFWKQQFQVPLLV